MLCVGVCMMLMHAIVYGLWPRKAACMCVCNTLYMHVCVHVRVHICVRVWHVRVHASRHPFFSVVGLVVHAYSHVQWQGRAIPYNCWPCHARPD